MDKIPIWRLCGIFHEACEENDFERIRACIAMGVDINCKGQDDHSALYNSVRKGNKKVFDFLVSQPDLDVQKINAEEFSRASLEAVSEENVDAMFRKLGKLHGFDNFAGHPLVEAITCLKMDAIRDLVEGSDLNAGPYFPGYPLSQYVPIAAALDRGLFEVVEILLSQPTLDLDWTDKNGDSVGHYAVAYKDTKEEYPEDLHVTSFPVKCVELLSKDPRVNWNIKNDEGQTPIMLALENKEKEMVKILLKNPKVDRGEILNTKEGMEILAEMRQENIASKVPECPVCLLQYTPDSRVFHCFRGHFVCGKCKPNLKHCPMCRGKMLGRRIRELKN